MGILEQKFKPPHQNIRLCQRAALLDTLFENVHCPVQVLVSAAGYGKSTVLAQFFEELQRRDDLTCMWVSLDANDNEANQFCRLFASALVHFGLADGRLINKANNTASRSDMPLFCDAVLDLILEQTSPIHIFLDDFHYIDQPNILTFFDRLLQYASSHIRLVIASRVTPKLNLSSLYASGSVIEFNDKALKFSLRETQTLVDDLLDKLQIEELYRLTEGWPVVTQMVRLWHQQNPDSEFSYLLNSNIIFLNRYFSEEIFNNLNRESQYFLMSTSFLNRLDCSLANHVCEIDNGAFLLSELKDFQSIIIPLTSPVPTFRYHHLFSDFLQQRLIELEGEAYLQKLRCRAAHWYFESDHLMEAIDQCVRAKTPKLAIEFIKQSGSWALVMQKGIGYTESVLSKFTPADIRQSSLLSMTQCYLHLKFGELERACQSLDTAKQHMMEQSSGSDAEPRDLLVMTHLLDLYRDLPIDGVVIGRTSSSIDQLDLTDHIARGVLLAVNVLQMTSVGQFERAKLAVEESVREMRLAECWVGVNYVLLHHGQMLGFTGDLEKALMMFDDAQNMASEHLGIDSGLQYMSQCLAADIVYQQGDVESAQQLLTVGIKALEERDSWVELYLSCYQLSVSLALANQDFVLAEHYLTRGYKVAAERHLSRLETMIRIQDLKIRVARGNGSSINITQWLDMLPTLDTDGQWRTNIELHLCLARYYGLVHQNNQAIQYAKSALKLASSIGMISAACEAKGLIALAYAERGEQNAANKWACDALSVCARYKLNRVLLDLPPAWETLCIKVKLQQEALLLSRSQREFLDQQLKHYHHQNDDEIGWGLSHREQQIVVLLEQGKTNKSIGVTLGISGNTVKFHMKNIYRKLGVNTRTQALIELDIIKGKKP